jgi:hypothetical protein
MYSIPKQHLFHHNLCYEDTDIHCVEIAVLRKLKYFQLIYNNLSFECQNNFLMTIFFFFFLTLRDRTWPEKSNGIGFRAI